MQCALNAFCDFTRASSMEDAALSRRIAPFRPLNAQTRESRELMVHNTCPQNQIQKKARSHPLQGWKSLGVQFNHMHMQRFKHQSSFGIQYVCEDGERILNQVIFHLVELRPDSGIVSYWLGLSLQTIQTVAWPRVITLG